MKLPWLFLILLVNLWTAFGMAQSQVSLFNLNVLAESPKPPYRDWSLLENGIEKGRSASVLGLILQQNADIVTLQEMRELTWKEMKEGLQTRYESFPTDLGTIGIDWQTAIFFDRFRFTLIDEGFEYLPTEPLFKSNRAIIWTVLRDKESAHDFVVMNTHWIPDFAVKNDKSRWDSSLLVSNLVRKFPSELPIVLAGDFNDTMNTSSPCRDCSLERLTDMAGDKFSIILPFVPTMVDHLLYRGFKTPFVQPIDPYFQGLAVTDHEYGIRAQFDLMPIQRRSPAVLPLNKNARLLKLSYSPEGDAVLQLSADAMQGNCPLVIDHVTNNFETIVESVELAIESGHPPAFVDLLAPPGTSCPTKISGIAFHPQPFK